MTTGTHITNVSVRDPRWPSTPLNWYYGTQAKKVWTGADWPVITSTVRKKVTYYKWVSSRGRRVRVEEHIDIDKVIRQRVRNNTEHTYNMTYTLYDQSKVRNTINGSFYPWDWLFGPLDVNLNGLWTSNDELTLLNKLNSKIASSEFDASVASAGAVDTVRMIGDTALRLGRAVRLARKGKITAAFDHLVHNGDQKRMHDIAAAKGIAGINPGDTLKLNRLHATYIERFLRHGDMTQLPPSLRRFADKAHTEYLAKRLLTEGAASNWLALQYGILPVLDDIDQGMKYLAYSASLPVEKVYKATRKLTKTDTFWGFPLTGQLIVSYKVTFYEAPNTASYLNAGDALSFAWEALPGSFIADWALPIGDYLSARQTVSRINGVAEVWRTDYMTKSGSIPNGHRQGGYLLDGRQAFEAASVNRRKVVLSAPYPSFKTWGKTLSVGHIQNGLALLVSAFK